MAVVEVLQNRTLSRRAMLSRGAAPIGDDRRALSRTVAALAERRPRADLGLCRAARTVSLPRPGFLGRFLRDRRGASAVEFAMVGGTLIATIVGVMMLGLLLYMGQALDRATAIAARQIMTGAVQKQGLSQSAFVTNVVCPALPATFACGNLIVNVQTVAEAAQPNGYYAFVNGNQTGLTVPATLSNASTQFNPGIQTSYVYLQVIYPITFLPSFMAVIFGAGATYNGSPAYLSISTAAFRNEQY